MAYGVISKREYVEEDIFDQAIYPRMKEEPLLDEDDCLVVPVRNKATPHFRRVGARSFGERLGRAENNPTHDKCVSYIYEELLMRSRGVKFSTYVFTGDGTYEEQVIFSTLPGSDYRWYREADARIAFHDGKFIQPDLAGRDANRFFPRSSCPNIIIEVIRTHMPDCSTFERLVELSKENCHIYFYFIDEGRRGGKFNNLRCSDECVVVRVSHYLIGGRLYKNGSPTLEQKEGETVSNWYRYLSNSYFKQAMEKS